MKKLGLVMLLVVGGLMIATLVWLQPDQAGTPNALANKLIIVALDTTVPDAYRVTIEPFGVVTFQAVGETQTINQQQLRLLNVTSTTAQVFVSNVSAE